MSVALNGCGHHAPDGVPGRSALATLADLHEAELQIPRPAPFATGFQPLDEVLSGGIQAGDLMLVGGKPGQGKTIAALQWARHMALTDSTSIVACYEHDEVVLLTRLIACELGEVLTAAPCADEVRLESLRRGLRAVATGLRPIREVLDSDRLLLEAEARLRAYAERLVLVRASGSRTDLDGLEALIEAHGGERTVLFVDYLQKVPVRPDPPDEGERVKRVVEGIKELALSKRVAVVSIAAADRTGLTSRRLRLHHFRGSTALAYEADVALVLNDKLTTVSKVHIAYDTTRIEEFRRQVVFSVEKNRSGSADVDLEFRKDFAHYRFDPSGTWVKERLWEEGALEE
jgi:replicative DNA helicase